MDKIIYTSLTEDSQEEWSQVESLFREMYVLMRELGIMLPLETGGEAKWITAARNTTGRFGNVIVAKRQDKVIGFAHGMIKFLPDYLGGKLVGIITHIFVEKDFRDKNIGAQMVTDLENWFRLKHVHSIELQVIYGNPDAMAFWKNLGFREELRQYRKILG